MERNPQFHSVEKDPGASPFARRALLMFRVAAILGGIATLYNSVFLIPGIGPGIGVGVSAWSSVLSAIFLTASLYSIWLCRRGQMQQAVIRLAVVVALTMPFWSLLTYLPGIWVVIVMGTLSLFLSLALLPPNLNWRVLAMTLISSVVTLLLDQYFPDEGQGAYATTNTLLVVGLVISYVILIVSQYRHYDLRLKLIIASLVVSLAPLWLMTWMNLDHSTQVLQTQTEGELSEAALQAANVVDLFIRNQMDTTRLEASLPFLNDYLALPPDLRTDSPQENLVQKIMTPLSQRNPLYVRSYALLDSRGVDYIDTDVNLIGLSEVGQDYFQHPMETGLSFVSPIRFDDVDGTPSLVFSSPVWDGKGNKLGVLRVRYDARVLQWLVSGVAHVDPHGLYIVLVDDETYLRLATTRGVDLLYKTYAPVEDLDVKRLQQEYRLPPGSTEDLSTQQPDVVQYLKESEQEATQQLFFTASSTAMNKGKDFSTAVHLQEAGWMVIARRSQQDVLAPIESQRRTSIILASLAAALVAVLAIGVAQVLVGPIARLTAVAERITAGDLKARAEPESPDEIGHLAIKFNEMTSQLQSTLETMEQHIQERTAELEAANRELEAFTYSASHDLRAPLRSIDGYSRLLQEDYSGKMDEEGKTYLDNIHRATQRMSDLIDALLNLSRLSRTELTWTRVDLSRLAWNSLEDLRHLEPEREIEMVVQPGLVVQGDPRLLYAMLDNLLRNAWKFTRNAPQPRIEFGAQPWEGTLAYYVSDNGAGFDMKYAYRLFGAFQRLHRPDEFEGTGIGLATVQRIVRRHNGQVWARGEIGNGATFYFTLGG